MNVKWVLRIGVALTLVCNFLLTPLGWEPRPFAAISTLGRVSIPLFWVTDGLNIAALVVLSGRPRLAARLFGFGVLTLLVPVIGDQTGLFCPTIPAPAAITGIEIVWPIVQLVLFGAALRRSGRPLGGFVGNYPGEARLR
jgi:hypothetical protein